MSRLPAPVVAAGLFSVVPMPPLPIIDRKDAARAVIWLPVLGAVFGLVAGGVGAAALILSESPLLAAVLTVVVMQTLVGAMHLDGLADTWDGLAALGSRKDGRDAEHALDIMHQPDTGAMGVVAIVAVLATQSAALAAFNDWRAFLVLPAVAAGVGRLGVPVNCRRGVPPAREGGFGALFCEVLSPLAAGAETLLAAAVVAAVGTLVFSPLVGLGLTGTLVACTLAGALWIRRLTNTLGGVTGDIFGALIEWETAAALVLAAVLPH